MQQIFLPQGLPLDHFKRFDLTALAPDRIFSYADPQLAKRMCNSLSTGTIREPSTVSIAFTWSPISINPVVLRWIAGQHAGVPNFDPLYTIE